MSRHLFYGFSLTASEAKQLCGLQWIDWESEIVDMEGPREITLGHKGIRWPAPIRWSAPDEYSLILWASNGVIGHDALLTFWKVHSADLGHISDRRVPSLTVEQQECDHEFRTAERTCLAWLQQLPLKRNRLAIAVSMLSAVLPGPLVGLVFAYVTQSGDKWHQWERRVHQEKYVREVD